MLDNDTDPRETPSCSRSTRAARGTVTDNGDGTVDYDPAGQFEALDDNETATDSFSYTVEDRTGTRPRPT